MLKPRQPGRYPDRDLDCEEAVDAKLRDLVDAANNAGWTTPEVLSAIERVVPHMRAAYNEDPDPADDPVQ